MHTGEYPIREEVVKRLLDDARKNYYRVGKEGAELSERAGWRCEYCSLDLLGSPEAFNLWCKDHIVPLRHKGEPVDLESFNNLAVACMLCNSAKSDWDPREKAGPGATRLQLIAAAKEYLSKDGWAQYKEFLHRTREIVGWKETTGSQY